MGAVVTSRGVDATSHSLERELVAAGYTLLPPQRTATTVLDTFDGRLHAADLRLDHTGSVLALVEAGGRAATVATPVPHVAGDLARGPFRTRLADVTEVRALLPQATVTAVARRAERRNADGKITSVVTIHDDIAADDRPLPGWLVTVEELTGYARPSERAAVVVGPHVADAVEGDAIDVVLSAAGVDRTGQHIEPGVELDPQAPAIEGYRLVLANLDEAIEANRQGTIDDIDPEFLHDLRVAARRSRSILRHGRNVLAPDVLAWAEEGLKLVGDLTGTPRDLDVQAMEWEGAIAGLDDAAQRSLEPLHRQLLADRSAAHAVMAERLAAGDVTTRLHRWRAALGSPMDPAGGGPRAGDPLLDVVVARVKKAQRRLLDHGRAIGPDTPADPVHEVRKDAKKLRYLLECFADLFPADERKAFVKRLKRLQELLGRHQDAAVQAAELHLAAERLPPSTGAATYLAIGRLVEHVERARQEARDGFAERFADYDSPATRAILREMVDGAGR